MRMFFPHKKYARRYTGVSAVLILALSGSLMQPAMAQEPGSSRRVQLVHLGPDAMSAADKSALQAHQGELVEAARIYGYNLEAENWSYEQTLCAPLPETILLHYRQQFPDGTESLFTALVPRGSGRVRIVPVLYRNATTFLPAPSNPRNYALYNDLVPQAIARREITSYSNWLELSACYAEMTGASVELPPGSTVDIGVARAPTATMHIDPKDKTARITFADRETERTYRVWSITFTQYGRVTAAGTEDFPVYAAGNAPQVEPMMTAEPSVASHPEQANVPAAASAQPEQAKEPVTARSQPVQTSAAPVSHAAQPSAETKQAAEMKQSTPASEPPAATRATTDQQDSEPGWKFIPEPPPPPEKITAEPPDPWDNSAPATKPPQ
jgi:hypothetical protein